MKELQGHAEQLQRENDQLGAQMEKSRNLGKYVRDGDKAMYQITRNKGKEPIILVNVDTPADDESSSSNSSSLSLSPTKNTQEFEKAKSWKRPPHHLAFRDAVCNSSYRARRETSRGRTSQFRPLGTRQYCPKVRHHRYCP